jgi:methyl-accepting chemotaxis protein
VLTKTLPKDDFTKPIIHALNNEEILMQDAIDYRGQAVIAATRYIAVADWGLIVKIDAEEAFAPITDLKRMTVLLTIIMLAIVSFIGYIIAKSIATPIEQLTRAAEQIARGNFNVHVEGVESKDEIGLLARAFNEMIVKLNASYQQIKAANQQLRASEQQLKAGNQQIRASEQQLRAANQQLKAASQQTLASEAKLKEKVVELEKFNRLTVDRELKMVELKKEITHLKGTSPKEGSHE